MTRTPAPSPRGTNREGLFLDPRGSAYDAIPGAPASVARPVKLAVGDRRRARDADDPHAKALDALTSHLGDRLSPNDLSKAHDMIAELLRTAPGNADTGDDDPDQDADLDDDDNSNGGPIAGDSQRRFPRPSELGGGLGLDSLSRSKGPGSARSTERAEAEFQRMFPGSKAPTIT